MPKKRHIALAACAFPVISVYTITKITPTKFDGFHSLPLHYDVPKFKEFWKNHPYHVVHRCAVVGTTALPFLSRFVVDWKLWKNLDEERRRKYAVEFRDLLTTLGPTFIKLGQAISIRPDVVPTYVLLELQKLCDKVPCYPTVEAISIIEEELGPVENFFEDLSLESEPIAGASLGQVYKCTLKSSGQDVAVKVQRPDMRAAVSLDLLLIRAAYSFYDKITAILTNQKPFHVALVDTFGAASYQELDYINESENQQRFQAALANFQHIKVPNVIPTHTSRRVLTTEWIDGEKLANAEPDVINELVPVGVECFLFQLLNMCFFHSDPHPGNLFVQNGKLVILDFGLCADIPLPDAKNLTTTFLHLMCADLDGLLDDLVDLGFLDSGDLQTDSIKQALRGVLDSGVLQNGATTDVRRKRLQTVSNELNTIFFEMPFSVPEYFALITRALLTLEGIALTGDRNFDIFEAAYPYIVNHAVNIFGYSTVLSLVGETLKSGSISKFRSDLIDKFRTELDN